MPSISSKRKIVATLAALAVCGITPLLVSPPHVHASDSVAVTDTSDTSWRGGTAEAYTFKDGLNFEFGETDDMKGGLHVETPATAEHHFYAEGDLSITQKNAGTNAYTSSNIGAFLYGRVKSWKPNPQKVEAHFEGDTIRFTGIFDSDNLETPENKTKSVDVQGLSMDGMSWTISEKGVTTTAIFDNKNTYLTTSYDSNKAPGSGSTARALSMERAVKAIFNSNLYATTTLNEHATMNGSAVYVTMGQVSFNGAETKLKALSKDTYKNRYGKGMSLYGTYSHGDYRGGSIKSTPYEQVRFNSPLTEISVITEGTSDAFGVFNFISDVNFTDNVKELKIDAKATGESGDDSREVKGIYVHSHGTTNVHAEDTNISTYSNDSSVSQNSALFVYSNGHINIDGSRLNLKSQSDVAEVQTVYAQGESDSKKGENDTVKLTQGNTIDLNADTMTITAEGAGNYESYAVYARGVDDSATININSDKDGNAQGKTLQVNGNVYAVAGYPRYKLVGDALINMNFTDAGSYLRGWSSHETRTEGSTAIVNFTFSNGAHWDMTADSAVTNLTVKDGGIVDMRADGNGYSRIFVKNLSGEGGTFKHDIDVRTMEADHIYVTDNFSGKQAIDIYQQDGYVPVKNSEEGHGLVLATVNGDGTFTAKDREGGLFYTRYDLASKASDTENYETDWYLNRIIYVEPEVKPTPTVEESYSSYGLTYGTWRTEMDKLLQRMGELRHNGEQEKGLWARVKGSKIGRDGAFGFENKYNHYELGYDNVVKQNESLTRYQGVSFSYIKGDGSYNSGTGSSHGAALSLYNTDIRHSGHYLDVILKVGRYNTDYTVYAETGDKIRGDFSNTGVAVSAEYGRKKALSSDGWYIEPQAQLSLGYFSGDTYHTSNGINIDQDNIWSAVGRIGVNIGKDLSDKSQVYVKANWYHDFAGKGGVTMTSPEGRIYMDQDFNDTWFTYGIGTTFQMNKNSHFYCDVERSTGGSFHTNWQWNVGMRMNF